jgi:hypothetical protein
MLALPIAWVGSASIKQNLPNSRGPQPAAMQRESFGNRRRTG